MSNKKGINEYKLKDNEDYSDDSIFNITSWGADLSFRELIQMYDENTLLKPEIQRNYVWDKVEASFFIDSILLGLPLPSIFLSKTKKENLLIIDGFQRIMTVYDYYNGKFSKDNKAFKLSKVSKINNKWRGKSFVELDDSEKKRIKNTTIHAIIFQQIHPQKGDTSLYQIFERINTSGRTLFPQEIRNCVYQGPFNELLIELNKNNKWKTLLGLVNDDSRMRDIELLLRFFAINSEFFCQQQTKSILLKKFLNEFMNQANDYSNSQLDGLKNDFNSIIDFISLNIGTNAFKNISKNSSSYSSKLNPAILDSVMIATHKALTSNNSIPKPDHFHLVKDEEFIEMTTIHTTEVENIKKRIKIASKILYGL